MIFYAPNIITILCYVIIISVAVAITALFSLKRQSPDYSILIDMYCTLSYCQINMFLLSYRQTSTPRKSRNYMKRMMNYR